jgi:serine/threonine-protein phosphatase PGAM5
MVRHGQYNLEGKVDEERYLTDLGRKQAELTGQRLALLYKDYALSKVSSVPNP